MFTPSLLTKRKTLLVITVVKSIYKVQYCKLMFDYCMEGDWLSDFS